jgi:hypothetical protein
MLNEFVEIKKVLAPHMHLLIDAALRISGHKDYGVNLREREITYNYSKLLLKKAGVAVIDKIIIIETGF